jgi:hypothetical protein
MRGLSSCLSLLIVSCHRGSPLLVVNVNLLLLVLVLHPSRMFFFLRLRMYLCVSTQSDWVECREVKSGKTLYYHRETLEIAFGVKPDEDAVQGPTKSKTLAGVCVGCLLCLLYSCFFLLLLLFLFLVVPLFCYPCPFLVPREGLSFFATVGFAGVRKAQMLESLESKDDEPDTPETARKRLLAYDHQWDFTNQRCERYRARVARCVRLLVD